MRDKILREEPVLHDLAGFAFIAGFASKKMLNAEKLATSETSKYLRNKNVMSISRELCFTIDWMLQDSFNLIHYFFFCTVNKWMGRIP